MEIAKEAGILTMNTFMEGFAEARVQYKGTRFESDLNQIEYKRSNEPAVSGFNEPMEKAKTKG